MFGTYYTSKYTNCITLDITRHTYISLYFTQQSLKRILKRRSSLTTFKMPYDVTYMYLETPVPSLHCVYQMKLCSICKEVHLSKKSKQDFFWLLKWRELFLGVSNIQKEFVNNMTFQFAEYVFPLINISKTR